MANFTATTTIDTAGGKISASASGNYGEVFRATLSAPFGTSMTGTLQEAIQTHTITSAGYAQDLKYLLIKNVGESTIELHFTIETWTDAAPDAHTSNSERFLRFLIPVGDYMLLPNIRVVDWDTEATAAGAGIIPQALGKAPDSNLYTALNTIAVSDPQLINEELDDSETSIVVDDATFFYPDDLIQIETEILRVTSISTATNIDVVRGASGSTPATHVDDSVIRLPFFNSHHPYGDTSINGGGNGSSALAKTDSYGNFSCTNMFGYGRDVNYEADGITAGSFGMQFRTDGGYQNFGLKGITSSTNSGLAVSTTYYFTLKIDEATATELSFTTDTTNVNFGGTNGIVSKMQAAIDAEYYDKDSNLFERGATVAIVGGDLRISSKSNRSGTEIAITAGTTGTTSTDMVANAIGRFKASVETAIPPTFPSRYSSKYDKPPITGSSAIVQNPTRVTPSFCWDDGKGNILGGVSGNINYGSGAINIHSAPPNADFIFWCSYGSALSGGMKSTNDACNSIKEFRFRGVNYNLDAKIEFIGMN